MQAATPRAILISGHYLGSKRRAGFHHLADAYWQFGWDVTFVTAAISLLSRLRGDYRFQYPVREEAGRLVAVRERMTSFVLLTLTHPGSLGSRPANRLSKPFFAGYGRVRLGPLEARLREADLVVFEGTAALLLVPRIRKLASGARLVYRASDDLQALGVHPLILEAEARAVPLFDLVSAPTPAIAGRLAQYGPVEVHPPGIDKSTLDRQTSSPYGPGPTAVFAGVSALFDYESLAAAAGAAPDLSFHIIGPARRTLPANVTFHREIPFEALAPYLQHATLGLLFFPPGYRSLGQGNKVAQYSYCRLPIVAPSDLQASRPNIVVFERGDVASLRAALDKAQRMPHSPAFAGGIMSAPELAALLAGDLPARGNG